MRENDAGRHWQILDPKTFYDIFFCSLEIGRIAFGLRLISDQSQDIGDKIGVTCGWLHAIHFGVEGPETFVGDFGHGPDVVQLVVEQLAVVGAEVFLVLRPGGQDEAT